MLEAHGVPQDSGWCQTTLLTAGVLSKVADLKRAAARGGRTKMPKFIIAQMTDARKRPHTIRQKPLLQRSWKAMEQRGGSPQSVADEGIESAESKEHIQKAYRAAALLSPREKLPIDTRLAQKQSKDPQNRAKECEGALLKSGVAPIFSKEELGKRTYIRQVGVSCNIRRASLNTGMATLVQGHDREENKEQNLLQTKKIAAFICQAPIPGQPVFEFLSLR